jgi:hypothetical protein
LILRLLMRMKKHSGNIDVNTLIGFVISDLLIM